MSLMTAATRAWLTRSLQPFRFTSQYENQLTYQGAEKLGLYVHIPFCRNLCSFCPYCKTVYHRETALQYVEALLSEITEVGKQNGGHRKEVTSLYFGGGTPALLAGEIQKIIQHLQRYFTITEGIGLELHPEDVTEETLHLLKVAGVSKISIGMQSFQDKYLELLGRETPNLDRISAALSKVSFETVSMDFIFALPGQTIEDLTSDIEAAFRVGANHVAIYPFIDFTFTKREFPKMGNREKKHLLYELTDYCKTRGYERDSIWTFSQQGSSRYSSMTRENFLGFGCSATTLLSDQFKINTFSVEEYIGRLQAHNLPTALTLRFTRRQRMAYYLFWTAYSMRVEPQEFQRFFGCSLEGQYGGELALARLLGLVCKEDGQYVMTKRGAYYYHYYENFYTLSYIDQMWHLMGKEAFPEELIIK